MIVTLRQVFQVSLNLMILTLCEADTSDEVVIATSRRPTLETTAATAHKSVEVSPKLNFEAMRPYFLHVDVDKVRKTFQRTTQFATNVMSGHRIIQTIQSPFLPTTSGVNEPVASDTIFSEVAAICTNGQMMAQILLVVLHLSLIFTECHLKTVRQHS
jgi:hypothetical protein